MLRKKINNAFCGVPPDAIVAWHKKVTEHLFKPGADAGVGGGVVVASTTLDDTSEAAVLFLRLTLVAVWVAPTANDTSETGVEEGVAGPSSEIEGADSQSVELAEADGSRGPSSDDGGTVSEPSQSQPLINNNDVILFADTPPYPSSASPSKPVTSIVLSTPDLPQVNDGSSDPSGSSESVLGKRALSNDNDDNDTDVASEVPPQTSLKRQRSNWWNPFSGFWF
ncbi:hypothetical protein BDZ89DRAFT_1152676 [Hymenopellis radicata]|nr:hypothetical protein BDZ89DRAFT_1152676 [Hymenopellis radicata]